MRPDPFSDPSDDGQQPDSSSPPAGPDAEAEARAEAEAEPGQQGLFLCLPAGSLDTDQFAQCGPAADMPPDPLLATIIDAVTGEDRKGLGGLSDDQLVGVIAGGRRLESRGAWYVMAAVAEFAARAAAEPCGAEFAADQLACELHLTRQSAAGQMDYTRAVTSRLPATFAALHAGAIHPVHVRIIAEETAILSAADAAKADAVLAEVAGSLTFGKLRAAAHKLVLELDPDSAERRKQAAKQDAHVRPFREESGNAGMIARELPPIRCWPRGSTCSSGRWTCAPPASPAPCRSCASGPTSTCCRSATAAASRPTRNRIPAKSPTQPAAPARRAAGPPTARRATATAAAPTAPTAPTQEAAKIVAQMRTAAAAARETAAVLTRTGTTAAAGRAAAAVQVAAVQVAAVPTDPPAARAAAASPAGVPGPASLRW